ncbi:DinB family protein [Flavobacterium lipolyticum]|uniref:DinB family protein n=1 Tax=Flavobacterium lipolyticum TaxID=2893754 RepID=A0ABS8LUJ6_9FLAO|nr:DinB family protein [Flavobacterium sp. F-126]MCC9016179.1 DinB family protein [Flavobacterium sp. F-126]
MQSEKLIQLLIDQTKDSINQAEKLKNDHIQTLTWKEDPASWNILECMEHLNLYGDYYLPQIKDKIKNSKTSSETHFNSGFLGGYFAKSMLPKEKLNKMKTFKDKNPLNSELDKSVIDKFINQQFELLALLEQSKKVSLNRIKIPTSLSRLLRLKLGDTFQFFIHHILRHLNQIDTIKESIKKTVPEHELS